MTTLISHLQKDVDIAFDPDKDSINLQKHGVSLAFGVRAFNDPKHIVLASIRPIDGEDRFKVIGMVDGKLWTAVHVHRDGVIRFMSVRRSNQGEERTYRRD